MVVCGSECVIYVCVSVCVRVFVSRQLCGIEGPIIKKSFVLVSSLTGKV